MSESLDQLSERISQVISQNRQSLTQRLELAIQPSQLSASNILSNFELLLQAIREFWRGDSASFFPVTISSQIRTFLSEAEPLLQALMPPDVQISSEQANTLLQQLDRIYAFCLQYGIISFGFSQKISTRIVDEIASERSSVKQSANRAKQSIVAKEVEFGALISAVREKVDSASGLLSIMTAQKDECEGKLKQISSLLLDAQASENKNKELSSAIERVVEKANEIQSSINAVSSAADREYESFTTRLQTQTTTARASVESIEQMQAKADLIQKNIAAFFNEIEKYRGSYADAKRDSDAHYNQLKEESKRLMDDYGGLTKEIVSKNLEIQAEIRDHLRKSVGISLFAAFDTRRGKLTRASWIWAVLLILSVLGTLAYGFWFVGHLKEVAGGDQQPSLIFARLALFAPLAFLIAFTAKRYSTERKAEEEYAFKSAISVSLDSFRELIARMRKDGEDTSLVEKLVLEVFDNPTKRLYGGGKSKAESEEDSSTFTDVFSKVLDKIPDAKK